jgi:activator of HSP90 ATPase
MAKTIVQSVVLAASPDELFDSYVDPQRHAAITGAAVRIGSAPGAEFHAFNGVLSGRILDVVPKRLIVQKWRSSQWTIDDLDSILILTFWPAPAGGRIDLVHANVADHDYDGVNEGWEKYYWTPWRAYLGRR